MPDFRHRFSVRHFSKINDQLIRKQQFADNSGSSPRTSSSPRPRAVPSGKGSPSGGRRVCGDPQVGRPADGNVRDDFGIGADTLREGKHDLLRDAAHRI